MTEIKIPLKHEIRSRAKVLTDEAFRETRNYLDIHSEIKINQNPGREFNNFNNKSYKGDENIDKGIIDQYYLRMNELRELLNKISVQNYHISLEQILKFNYDEELLENFKVDNVYFLREEFAFC